MCTGVILALNLVGARFASDAFNLILGLVLLGGLLCGFVLL